MTLAYQFEQVRRSPANGRHHSSTTYTAQLHALRRREGRCAHFHGYKRARTCVHYRHKRAGLRATASPPFQRRRRLLCLIVFISNLTIKRFWTLHNWRRAATGTGLHSSRHSTHDSLARLWHLLVWIELGVTLGLFHTASIYRTAHLPSGRTWQFTAATYADVA